MYYAEKYVLTLKVNSAMILKVPEHFLSNEVFTTPRYHIAPKTFVLKSLKIIYINVVIYIFIIYFSLHLLDD